MVFPMGSLACSGGIIVHVGDEVVIMSAPGRFRVITIQGPVIIIENAEGVRKTVLVQSLRVIRHAR
jgi:hypothetical protein